MSRKKKIKTPVKDSADQKKQVREDSSPHFQAGKNAVIGMIGWNSPKFIESDGEFIKNLKKSIMTENGSPLFFGISGGSDLFPAAARIDASGFQQFSGHGTSGQPHASNGNRFDSTLNYGLPSRDIVADQIEILVQEERLNGLVMLPWSINSLVGMLMATIRCGVPTLFLPHYRLWPIFLESGCQDPYTKSGIDSFFYSRHSLLVLLEVFGLSKMGTLEEAFSDESMNNKPLKKRTNDTLEKTVLAGNETENLEVSNLSEKFRELIAWAGRRIVEMTKQKISPRRFFSQAAFQNALCVDMALGSSTETILHLSALSKESGFFLPISFFNETSKKVPQLVPLNRFGEFSFGEFLKWGGLFPLLGALHSFLQASPTVAGKNIIEIAKENNSTKSSYKLTHPYKKHGGLAILFGNLATEGALFRAAALKEQWYSHSGIAKVFDSEDQCVAAIRSHKVKKGDLIVIRYCGPKGCPGMPYLRALKDALEENTLEESITVLTDGRAILSGKTAAFVHVSPEAAVGSALSIIQDGDLVTWNFFNRSITLRLTDTEIKVRLSRWKEQEKNMKNSFLSRYCKYSSPSSLGATLT